MELTRSKEVALIMAVDKLEKASNGIIRFSRFSQVINGTYFEYPSTVFVMRFARSNIYAVMPVNPDYVVFEMAKYNNEATGAMRFARKMYIKLFFRCLWNCIRRKSDNIPSMIDDVPVDALRNLEKMMETVDSMKQAEEDVQCG